MPDLELADDAAFVTSTRECAQVALSVFNDVATSFGLTINFSKTKVLCCGPRVSEADRRPLLVHDREVECVSSFVYLGCLMTPDGRIGAELDRRLASASRAFGVLRCVFDDQQLSLRTRRMVHLACIVSLLLYGAECWPILGRDEHRLDAFHHQRLRILLGVSRWDQELQHISNGELRKRWGDSDLLFDVLRRRRLQWLGHAARMPSERLPKQVLFGWLSKTRLAHGSRLRWRDRIHADFRALLISNWYTLAQDRHGW